VALAIIGFIGLGNMGAPMAENLVRAGHDVRGFDLAPTLRARAESAGIIWAADAGAAARDADVVITMLPAGQHVVASYEGGLLAAVAKDTLFVDCSTIDVDSARRAHALAEAAGMVSVDAPVSGGTGGAAAATLTFMAGGSPVAFARAKAVLEAMGKRIVYCGEAGAGQAAKICNNMILGVSMIAVSEAFILAEKLGLSHQALFDVASTSSGQCWALTTYCPVPGPVPASPANKDYKPGFGSGLMLKDLRLAQQAAESVGADTVLGRHAAGIYAAFDAAGQAGLDFSAIIHAIRARSIGSSESRTKGRIPDAHIRCSRGRRT
jgi:3-hydroxyisobutyrate dehydrogenase